MVSRLNPPGHGLEFGLFIADGTTRLGEVDAYESAEVIARFNDVSTWELVVPTKSVAAQMLMEAARPRLLIYTSPGVVFRSGPVIAVEREVELDGDMLTVSGVDDMAWLARRLAHPQPLKASPPYNGQAYDTRTGSASQVMAAFVDANAGPAAHAARRVPGLTVPVPATLGPTVKVSARYQNLLDLVKRTAARSRLGIEVRDLAFPGCSNRAVRTPCSARN